MFTIVWDDEHCCDSFGSYETIEEARADLKDIAYSSIIEMACVDYENSEIEWDDDDLGFLFIAWNGLDKDTAVDYFERTYKVEEA